MDILTAVAAGVGIIAGIYAIIDFYRKKSSKPDKPTTSNEPNTGVGGINANGGANVSAGNTTIINNDLEAFSKVLLKREKELRDEFEKTSKDDKEKLDLITRELSGVNSQRDNLQASFEAEKSGGKRRKKSWMT